MASPLPASKAPLSSFHSFSLINVPQRALIPQDACSVHCMCMKYQAKEWHSLTVCSSGPAPLQHCIKLIDLPATKPAAAVETTRALRRCLASCLYTCTSSTPEALPLVLAVPADRRALEVDAAADEPADPDTRACSALMHCAAALGAELKPNLLTAASPTDICRRLIASTSRETDESTLEIPLMCGPDGD